MAKSKSMTIGLLGTGKASIKSASALIGDLTESATDVTFVVPVTPTHFTSDIEAILEWAHDEGHKYIAVLDDTSADTKDLADYIEAAEQTFKVAKPAVKVVNLLERADDGRLLMLWDDEDDDCMTALERAVDREVPALDLTNGLDVLQFDDPASESAEEGEVKKSAKDDDEEDGTPERTVEAADDDDPVAEFAPKDDLDTLGVRKLRDMVEEELGLTRRKVGQMSKDDCIDALRKHRSGGQETPASRDDDEGGDEAQQPTRARERAAQREEEPTEDEPVAAQQVKGESVQATVDVEWQTQRLREAALDFAIRSAGEAKPDAVVTRAEAYLAFLRG